jgi:hypothetical protein
MNKRIILGLLIVGLLSIVLLNKIFPDIHNFEQEYEELSVVRLRAYEYALTCSNTTTPTLNFKDVNWVLVPGSHIMFPTLEGNLRLKGWFNPKDSTIYIPQTEKDTFWILVHESLHAIGYMNHPDIPFRICGVMPDQN